MNKKIRKQYRGKIEVVTLIDGSYRATWYDDGREVTRYGVSEEAAFLAAENTAIRYDAYRRAVEWQNRPLGAVYEAG